MAQLIGLKERQLGLAEIESKLKELSKVRDFLNQENPTGVYTLSFEKQRVKLHCPNRTVINDLVNAYKKSLIDELQAMAEKYSVEFAESELELLK